MRHNLMIATELGGADRVRWGLEGRLKAGSDSRVPLLHRHSAY